MLFDMPELEIIAMKRRGKRSSDIVIITRTPFRSSLIQISIPLQIRISDFVIMIKSITGRLLKKRLEYMRLFEDTKSKHIGEQTAYGQMAIFTRG